MWKILLSLMALASGVRGRGSHHADLVRDAMLSKDFSRFSDNVLEDALLDVPDLISKYGYPVEVHQVTTEDGYLLEVHRIPMGKGQVAWPFPRQPVLVVHGMFGSSADFVLTGPGSALAYQLADSGYDVWLANARGTYYSRRHQTLDPDANVNFWKFSWDEIGHLDLSATVDHIILTTGVQKVHYIGYSQGGTTFFVMTSMKPEYNDKLSTVQLMAPAVFNTVENRPGLELVAPYLTVLENILYLRGVAEMFPNGGWLSSFAQQNCHDGSSMQSVCSAIFAAFAGSSSQHNATIMPLILGHTPAGASFRQIAHFSQQVVDGDFRRYNYGTQIQNLIHYGTRTPPQYDLSKVTVPIHTYYAEADQAVNVAAIFELHSRLPSTGGIFKIDHESFNHIDFLYGNNATALVYDRIVALMRFFDGQ